MRPYTFFKHRDCESVPSFELGEFDDHAGAQVHALGLMAGEPGFIAVEIWDGLSEPVRVSRPAAPSESSASPSAARL